MVPFVQEAVDFDVLDRTLRNRVSPAEWPQSVCKFRDRYFAGNSEDLRYAFLNTYFSPGFFGAMCATYLTSKKPSRFQKRSKSQNQEIVGEFLVEESKETKKRIDIFSAKASLESLEEILNDFKDNVEHRRKGISKVPEFLFDLKKRIIEEMLWDQSTLIGDDESDLLRLIRIKRDFDELKAADQSTYFEENIAKFFKLVEQSLGKKTRDFIYSPIPSGVSLRVSYKNGLIQNASADLNGKFIDVTELVRAMRIIPGIINEKKDVTFLGYLFLTNKTFRILNNQRISKGQAGWLDPKSAINFALTSMAGPSKLLGFELSALFDSVSHGGNNKMENDYHYIKKQGLLVTPSHYVMAGSLESVHYIQRSLANLPFATAGIKVSLKDISEEKLIHNGPRHCVYKTAPEFHETTVDSIKFKVQPTGIVSAIVNVNPVNIDGHALTKFVISNETDLKALELTENDRLILYCYPGLEPQIFKILREGGKRSPFVFPSECPKCESPLKWSTEEGKKVGCCSAHLVCVDDSVKDITHFVSRFALHVPSLGENLIKELIEKDIITTVTDLFRLSEKDWTLINSVSFDEFKRILEEIQIAKNTTLEGFIYGLNIPSVSSLMAGAIARLAGSISRLKEMTVKDLLKSEYIDKEAARKIVEFFLNKENHDRVQSLLSVVNFSTSKEITELCYKESYTKEDYIKIVSKINQCDESPLTLTDADYDILIETAEKIVNKHPEWEQRSLKQKHQDRRQVTWTDPLKLQKTYLREKLELFLQECADGVIVEPKVNGVACSLRYENGKLVEAYTRASHLQKNEAFDITDFIKGTRIPQKLKKPFTGTIRGELFLSEKELSKINESRSGSGLKTYNDSVAAIGALTKSIRKQDKHAQVYEEIQFFGYHLADCEHADELYAIKTRLDLYNVLSKLGLVCTIKKPKFFKHALDALPYITDDEARRSEFPTSIDGMVVKSLDMNLDEIKPTGTKYTPGMLGYKFTLKTLRTKLRGVEFSVAKNGLVKAVVQVEPVHAQNGRVISRVFLSNTDQIKGAHEGDSIDINYAGGILPVCASIHTQRENRKAPSIAVPENCPTCQTKLQKKEGETLHCVNTMCMGSSSVPLMQIFSQRMGIGNKTSVRKLIEKGIVKKPTDFYRILPEDLRIMAELSPLAVARLLSALEKSKKTSFSRLLYSFNLPKIGPSSVEKVVTITPSLKDLLAFNEEKMRTISPHTRLLMRKILKFVNKNREDLNYLLKIGLTEPEQKNTKQTKESVTLVDLNQVYSTYRGGEDALSSQFKTTLENLKRISKENQSLLELLTGMKASSPKRLRLMNHINEAEIRNQKLLKHLEEFLSKQGHAA